VRVAGVIAAAMNPVVLLGDVCERQKVRERARNGQPGRNRHVAQQPIDVLELAVGRARPLGCLAHLLDPVEDVVPFVVPQHTSKHLPEQAHVVSQRLVWIGSHAAILSGSISTECAASAGPTKIDVSVGGTTNHQPPTYLAACS
jgi:hypothetical protein